MRHALLLAFALTLPGHAQERPSATMYGNCSQQITSNSGVVNVVCTGMDAKSAKKLLELLNDLKARQLDPEWLRGKLNKIDEGVGEIKAMQIGRTLTPDATKRLTEWANHMRAAVEVYSYNGATSSDVATLIRQIKACLTKANILAPAAAMNFPFRSGTEPDDGIVILAKPGYGDAANTLKTILDEGGAGPNVTIRAEGSAVALSIVILSRPAIRP